MLSIERRQDLEAKFPEAYASLETVVEEEEEMPLLMVSCRWLTAGHPDPSNFHLRVLCRFLFDCELATRERHARAKCIWPLEIARAACFWDFPSLHQPARLAGQVEVPSAEPTFRACLGSPRLALCTF